MSGKLDKKGASSRVLLFDLDGTLIDSTEAIVESFERSFEALGLPEVDRSRILPLIGHPLPQMYRQLGVEDQRIESIVSRYKEHYRKIHTSKTVLLPGVAKALTEVSRSARLGVVTTKTGRYARELLEHFGLMELFEVLIGSEDVRRHKPDPEPIDRALELMGVKGQQKERVWMIGDTCLDIRAARCAGVRGVAVECGYGKPEELRRCAHLVAKDVAEALNRID